MNKGEITFEPMDIESGIRKIRATIFLRKNSSETKQQDRKKFDIWIQYLDIILDQISKSDDIDFPPVLKEISRLNKNLIVIAMLQPSLKNIFNEIKVHFRREPGFERFHEELTRLGNGPKTARSLAWIGDTVIKSAILTKIVRLGISPEELHNKRQSLETNKNLSNLSDRWKLFEHRIHLDPEVPKPKSIEKIKGTLVESMFGIIFIEKGSPGVQEAISMIDTSENKMQ